MTAKNLTPDQLAAIQALPLPPGWRLRPIHVVLERRWSDLDAPTPDDKNATVEYDPTRGEFYAQVGDSSVIYPHDVPLAKEALTVLLGATNAIDDAR